MQAIRARMELHAHLAVEVIHAYVRSVMKEQIAKLVSVNLIIKDTERAKKVLKIHYQWRRGGGGDFMLAMIQ